MRYRRFRFGTQRVAFGSLRRRTVLALGSAAVATALVAPSVTDAGKSGKKAKKRKRKTCGRQIDQCRNAIETFCEGEESCINNFDQCCPLLSDCDAGAAMDCFFDHVA